MRKLLIIMACVALGGCATFSEPKFQPLQSEQIAKHRVKPTGKHVSPVVVPARPSPPAAATKPKRKHWWHKLPRWL